MRQIIVLFSACLLCSLYGKAQEFTLTGKVAGQPSGWVKLYYADSQGKRIKDSCQLVDGQFKFRGNIAEPTMAYLDEAAFPGAMDDSDATSFFLEPTAINIDLKYKDFKDAVITGSKTQEEYAALEAQKKPIYEEMAPLGKAYTLASNALRKAMKEKKDEATIDSLKNKAADLHDEFDPYYARAAQLDYAFFASHPQSYATAFYLQFHVSSLTIDSLQMFYDRLGADVQKSHMGKEIAKQMAELKAGSPGSVAADFTAKDINGNTLTLSTFKGKYILIDFWASWCVPCRRSMPHVKELYAEYKDKGLEVIGVSDDDNDSSAWKKAVATDGTGVWHNVLRGLDWAKLRKGEKSEHDISDKFGIHSLPTKILIDRDGVIIGRYDKGTEEEAAAMDKKLAEAMGTH